MSLAAKILGDIDDVLAEPKHSTFHHLGRFIPEGNKVHFARKDSTLTVESQAITLVQGAIVKRCEVGEMPHGGRVISLTQGVSDLQDRTLATVVAKYEVESEEPPQQDPIAQAVAYIETAIKKAFSMKRMNRFLQSSLGLYKIKNGKILFEEEPLEYALDESDPDPQMFHSVFGSDYTVLSVNFGVESPLAQGTSRILTLSSYGDQSPIIKPPFLGLCPIEPVCWTDVRRLKAKRSVPKWRVRGEIPDHLTEMDIISFLIMPHLRGA